MIGAELGYRYVGSPIIWTSRASRHDFREYVPTTWPGARLPHVWLDDGSAMQDRIGDGYTLLRLGGAPPTRRRSQAHSAPSARRSRCSISPERPRATSTATI